MGKYVLPSSPELPDEIDQGTIFGEIAAEGIPIVIVPGDLLLPDYIFDKDFVIVLGLCKHCSGAKGKAERQE